MSGTNPAARDDATLLRPLYWHQGGIRLLDQTRLPDQERWRDIDRIEDLCEAIRDLQVRGAPALGLAAAYGMALAARVALRQGEVGSAFDAALARARRVLAATRPTASNLFGALALTERVQAALQNSGEGPERVAEGLLAHALASHEHDIAQGRAIGEAGAALLPAEAGVLTHCNTGALATGGYGTALGVVRTAWKQGRLARVWHTETRPLLQGARLTGWELDRLGIPHRLLVDSAAAALLRTGEVDAVIVGADRIAANGDTANKVGTLGLAVAARWAGIPFYVAAPLSTVDPLTPDGTAITIEERGAEEIVRWGERLTAPEGTSVSVQSIAL